MNPETGVDGSDFLDWPEARMRGVDGGTLCLTTFVPILISLSFKLVSDQSLIGSSVATVRKKLPR
jgi:hypothetical protein